VGAGGNNTPGLEVELTHEARAWLEFECHADPSVRETVRARFGHIFDLLELHGLAVGRPKVAHLHGRENLWEARVQHTTGAYRLFFGIARGGIAVFACGRSKKSTRFHGTSMTPWSREFVPPCVALSKAGMLAPRR
jgi:hypothetical protein